MNKTYVYNGDKRKIKSLSTLNFIPFTFMFTWIMFIIVIYTNPNVLSGFRVIDNESNPFSYFVFNPSDKYLFICNALRIIALVYALFQLASLIVGFISVKRPRCVKLWKLLCVINVVLAIISTNIISAGITGYIFARLSNIKVLSENDTLCQ